MKPALIPLLLLPLLAWAEGERQTYTCDNGSRIEISFASNDEGRPQATLHFADDAVVLSQVPSASGALYRNETLRLHSREDQLLIEDAQHNRRQCQRGDQGPLVAQATPPAATGSFLDVGGTIRYAPPTALPSAAVLVIQIAARSRPGQRPRPLAEQRLELADQPNTIPFQTSIDRDLLGRRNTLIVNAHVEFKGKRLLAGEGRYKLTSGGSVDAVDILLLKAPRRAR